MPFRFGWPESRQVAILFNDITDRRRAESELRQAKDDLEVRVRERTEALTRALQSLRSETEERLRGEEELRAKEQQLMQQSRMAAMGEMIGFIGHQWRQPLNSLALIVQEASMRYKMGDFDAKYLDGCTAEAMRVIKQMSQTIDDFSNFFKADKRKVPFVVKEILDSTIKLVEASFRHYQVAIEIFAQDEVVIEGLPNEYAQVLLNILMNARDALLDRKVERPRIVVRIFTEHDKAVTTIADNAGGIPEEMMERIFEPYFTTKGPDKGTGVGLYMAKTIIEKHLGGRLSVRNTEEGAEFRIEVEQGAHTLS
jgi:C4-dicarboxylate-specific signal transduction histidine kinase